MDESVSATPPPQPFAICAAKATPCRVTHLQWSPTAQDLVAVAFEEEPLTLYRLPWKRVWSCRGPAPVTALCWSPDGKWLAVGLKDGSVRCLVEETGALHHSFQHESQNDVPEGRAPPEQIVCLNWTHRGGKRGASEGKCEAKDASVFLEVPTEVQKQPMDVSDVYKEFDHLNAITMTAVPKTIEAEKETEGILTVANQTGIVSCYVSAKVPMAEFDPSALVESPVSTATTYEV